MCVITGFHGQIRLDLLARELPWGRIADRFSVSQSHQIGSSLADSFMFGMPRPSSAIWQRPGKVDDRAFDGRARDFSGVEP
jgi:hypothetical protein